jgi:hypothetical protein
MSGFDLLELNGTDLRQHCWNDATWRSAYDARLGHCCQFDGIHSNRAPSETCVPLHGRAEQVHAIATSLEPFPQRAAAQT